MAMRYVETELNKLGEKDLADIIAGVHGKLGRDIPLSTEARAETKRFTPEQRKALKKQGFVIYDLTGQSIRTLRDSGRQFWTTWHKDFPDFEALGSMQSEVAINPNRLFLPESNNKTLAQQQEMVSKFSKELGKKVRGIKAIIGQAPDYVELAFRHLDETGDYLFGAKYSYDATATKTPKSGSRVVYVVGKFDADNGLIVSYWNILAGHGHIRVAPLVVPASNA